MASKFEIVEYLGSGQFSNVYKIRKKYGNNIMALKMEKDDVPLPMIQFEAKILHYLQGESCYHIPHIYYYGIFEERPSMALSFYDISYEDYILQTDFPREPKEPETLFREIIKILKSIHLAKIIHCDIKPANFMMKNGELYLVDFGLAKIYVDHENSVIPDKFPLSHVLGTPKYISIFIHEGHSSSLRDDILSSLYVYLFSKTKELPWEYVSENDVTQDPLDKIDHPQNKERLLKKRAFHDYVNESHLGQALTLIQNIGFGEVPDYTKLLNLFITLI